MHVPETTLEKIDGGTSKLVELVLAAFWGGDGMHDFARTGLRLPSGTAEPAAHGVAEPADGEAAPAIWKATFASLANMQRCPQGFVKY